jgi:tetratricopeptide (TPR) repeat protein
MPGAAILIAILWLMPMRGAPSQGAAQESDRSFSYGEDEARDRQALALLERALSAGGGDYELLWRTARAAYYVGDAAPAKAKLGYFERGIAHGERATALRPASPEGHFWLGANYGGWSELKGAFRALATVRKIRAEMETVVRIAPGYEDGRAYLALGELDRQLPRLLGGSISRAILQLERGVRIAPHNLELRLALAVAYREAGRREEAQREAREVLTRPINPARARAERGAQEGARRLLAQSR